MINTRILDRISTGICIVDGDLKVLLWNVEMENITGVYGRDIAGAPLSDFFPRFSEEALGMRLEMALSGPPVVFSPLLHRTLFITPSAAKKPYLEVVVNSLFSDESEVLLLFTVRDVTNLNLQIKKYREMKDIALEEVKRRQEIGRELEAANRKLKELADTDPLTGLLNRRSLTEMINMEMERKRRHTGSLSVIMGDIDNFKKFNDIYGHDCGDLVLVKTGEILKSNFRSIDTVARWGGEEFLVLLPEAAKENAREAAEKIRRMISSMSVECEGISLSVTITLGVAEYVEGESAESLIKRADLALYEGKKQGRNRVVVSGPSGGDVYVE